MKILFVIYAFNSGGGAEKVCINIANHCKLEQDDVTLITTDANCYNNLLSPSIKIIKVSSKRTLLYNVIKEVVKNRYDMVFSSMFLVNLVTGFARLFARFELVQRQTFIVKESDLKSTKIKLFTSLQSYIYRNQCSTVIANSENTCEVLQKIYKLPLHKIRIIGNPVFDEKLIKEKGDMDYYLPFGVDKSYILSVGSLRREKNYEFLIESFSLIINQTTCNLVILGSGQYKQQLDDQIIRLQLSDRVFLVDFCENPYPYYKNCRLFISSSERESFGNVIVEALAFGIPIVATKTGGAEFILNNGEFGEICSNFDPVDFSTLILNSINKNNIQKTKLIERAKKFSIAQSGSAYRDLFMELINTHN